MGGEKKKKKASWEGVQRSPSFYDERNADPGTDSASGSSAAPGNPRVLPLCGRRGVCAELTAPPEHPPAGRCSLPSPELRLGGNRTAIDPTRREKMVGAEEPGPGGGGGGSSAFVPKLGFWGAHALGVPRRGGPGGGGCPGGQAQGKSSPGERRPDSELCSGLRGEEGGGGGAVPC